MPTTTTFSPTGDRQVFFVPAGVTSVTVDAYGAQGSGAEIGSGQGGQGGRVQGTITVTPGEALYLRVGRSGPNGGFNGGGRTGLSAQYGGGATDVRRGGDNLSHRVLVAPGGGASSASQAYGGGHGGGLTGSAGQSNPSGATYAGGTGGSQTAGGTAGGALGVGGSSSTAEANPGGAGGGGFYGGGSGASAGPGESGAGGGGGSALVPAGGTTTAGGGLRLGDGILTLTYNQPPSAPILLAPPNNGAVDIGAINRFSWQHVDPDADAQGAFDLRYRQTNTTTWTTVAGSGPNGYHDIAAGTLTAGSYEWQVRTYDTSGLVGAWSASSFFTATTPPAGPSITAPINGETIGQAAAVLTWTATAQDAYQVRKLADLNGAANTAAVLYDSGEVVDAAARSVTLTFDVNSRYEHLQVRVKSAGLFSAWASVRILVSYTLPAKALLSVVPDEAAYALAVRVVNPTPTDGQPARSFNRIYCTALTPGDSLRPLGVRKLVAAQFIGSVFLDDRVASGVDYGYDVETVAANGTTSQSAFVTGFVDLGVAATDPFEPTFTTTY